MVDDPARNQSETGENRCGKKRMAEGWVLGRMEESQARACLMSGLGFLGDPAARLLAVITKPIPDHPAAKFLASGREVLPSG